jgi:hypothetical protein
VARQDGEVMKERGVRQLLRQRRDQAEDPLEACQMFGKVRGLVGGIRSCSVYAY